MGLEKEIMSEAANKIRARMHDEPDYPCMVKAEILGWAELAEGEITRLNAEILEARNEAATVRRAYLHEKKRAEDAIQWLRAYEPGPASVLEAQAYTGAAVVMCSGKTNG